MSTHGCDDHPNIVRILWSKISIKPKIQSVLISNGLISLPVDWILALHQDISRTCVAGWTRFYQIACALYFLYLKAVKSGFIHIN
jgi:hypothetical protein